MRIQSLQTYKALQQIKHFNAYTIILIYNINPDGGELTRWIWIIFRKAGVNRAQANCRGVNWRWAVMDLGRTRHRTKLLSAKLNTLVLQNVCIIPFKRWRAFSFSTTSDINVTCNNLGEIFSLVWFTRYFPFDLRAEYAGYQSRKSWPSYSDWVKHVSNPISFDLYILNQWWFNPRMTMHFLPIKTLGNISPYIV